jgi:CubicO group peptidase (beta-lactamase class C family)
VVETGDALPTSFFPSTPVISGGLHRPVPATPSRFMTRFLFLVLAASALLAPRSMRAQDPVPLEVGATRADSLGPDEVDRFTIPLEGDRFVVGVADQRTLDVVITVYAPDGRQLVSADNSARGPDPFQFDTGEPGEYRIEVAPFEGQSGRYAIAVERVEPVAEDPAGRVDQIMATYDGEDVPGGVVAVVRGGELVFAEGYGMANLTHGVPFEVDTRTNIGSTSKQFTAFAILLLERDGRLSLDDDVRTHIPELPDLGETVTLRHLLTHTGGYREFLNTLALTGRRIDEGDYVDRDEIIDLVQRQPELQNDPGAEWNYNNTGFALLAMVVERVTGDPFPEWMEAHVFAPLGMDHTMVRSSPREIVPHSAQGYLPAEEGGWREATDLGGAMGAGGIYTTVGDLARWIRNFERGEVGGLELFDRMTTRYVLTDGDTTDYGFGLFVDEYRGLRRVHHGGADLAHRSMLQYHPDAGTGIITLSNNGGFSGSVASRVADAFLADRLEPEDGASAIADEGAPFDPESYDPADFEGLAGRYALDEMPAFVLTFTREEDGFYTQATGQPSIRINPTSDSTFELVGVAARITFHRDGDGVADSLTLHQNGDHLARRVEEAAWEPGPADLEPYVGRYYSPELETFYTIVVEDDALVLRHRRLEDVRLNPGSERHTFTGGFPVAEARFLTGESGEVEGLEVSNGRTRDVRFRRVPDEAPPFD